MLAVSDITSGPPEDWNRIIVGTGVSLLSTAPSLCWRLPGEAKGSRAASSGLLKSGFFTFKDFSLKVGNFQAYSA